MIGTSLVRHPNAPETSVVEMKPAGHRSVTLQSAVRLLTEAGRALWRNKDEAQLCIAKAAALLQAESDVAPTGAGTSGTSRQPLAPWQVARVVRFIDANLSQKIGVGDFAAIARLSPGHFGRAFRASVGESPYAYVIRRRIEHAQDLVLRTDKPLAQIALDCGLADQAHMTRLFRRFVGMSPGAWRRRHDATAKDCDKLFPGRPPSRGVGKNELLMHV